MKWPSAKMIMSFIVLTAAVVTIVANISKLIQDRHKKAIAVEVISNIKLINNEFPTKSNELSILYKNNFIPNVTISDIRITNTGNFAIEKKDMESELYIEMSTMDIISSRVILSKPGYLPVSTKIVKSQIVIEKTLLNPGDNFTVRVVSVPRESESNVVFGAGGRISGISNIQFRTYLQSKEQNWSSFKQYIIGMLVGMLIGLVSGILLKRTRFFRFC